MPILFPRARLVLLFGVFQAAVLMLGFSSPVVATTFMPRPFPEVVQDAPIIARGKIGSKAADYVKGEDGVKRIYTFYDLQVTEVFKGNAPLGRIKIREMGGEKDGRGMMVSGTAQFEPGEDVVVLLGERNTDSSYDVRGLMMGKMTLRQNATGEEVLVGPVIDQGLLEGHDGHPGEEREGQNDTPPPAREWTLDSLRKLVREQNSPSTAEPSAKPAQFQSPSPSPLAAAPQTPATEQPAPQLQPPPTEGEKDPQGFGFLPWIGLALGGLGAVMWLRRKR